MNKPNLTMKKLSELIKLLENGTIKTDHPAQREDEQWKIASFVQLLFAMLEGWMRILPMSFSDHKTFMYLLDGKQKLTNFLKFLLNEFALPKGLPDISIMMSNGKYRTYNLSGKNFSDIDPDIQNIILNYKFDIIIYTGLSLEQECEVYENINSGASVNQNQSLRPLYTKKDKRIIKCIDNMLKDCPLSRKTKLSRSEEKASLDLMHVSKALMLGYDGVQQFKVEKVRSYISNKLSYDDVKNFESKYRKFYKVLKANKNINRASIPIILAGLLVTKDINKYANNIDEFFNHYDDDTDYHIDYKKECGKGGHTSERSVYARWNVIEKIALEK